jgi:phytoene synthase
VAGIDVSLNPAGESVPGISLAAAYRYCEDVTRRSGTSFSAAFWMLPKPKRRALHAIYAFCRLADDIADDPDLGDDRTLLLKRWREELDGAYRGKATHPVSIALGDAVHHFRLPESLFSDLLAGIEFDLAGEPIETFDDLRQYCYRVASTVGLLVVRVIGFQNPQTLEYAETLGIAVQLTNILRDIGGDATSGRVYLPREELERFGVSVADLEKGTRTDGLQEMLDHYAQRAHRYYEEADLLLPSEDRRVLRPAQAMGKIYRTLLDELDQQNFPCFEEPLRLPKYRRLAIAGAVWLGLS